MLWHMFIHISWPLKCPVTKYMGQKRRLWPTFASFGGTNLDDPQTQTVLPHWVGSTLRCHNLCFIHEEKARIRFMKTGKVGKMQYLLQSASGRKGNLKRDKDFNFHTQPPPELMLVFMLWWHSSMFKKLQSEIKSRIWVLLTEVSNDTSSTQDEMSLSCSLPIPCPFVLFL